MTTSWIEIFQKPLHLGALTVTSNLDLPKSINFSYIRPKLAINEGSDQIVAFDGHNMLMIGNERFEPIKSAWRDYLKPKKGMVSHSSTLLFNFDVPQVNELHKMEVAYSGNAQSTFVVTTHIAQVIKLNTRVKVECEAIDVDLKVMLGIAGYFWTIEENDRTSG
jgi:hypothetical protein